MKRYAILDGGLEELEGGDWVRHEVAADLLSALRAIASATMDDATRTVAILAIRKAEGK